MPTSQGSEIDAEYLLAQLVGTNNAALPYVNLWDQLHTVPWTPESDLLKPVKRIEASDLVREFQAIQDGLQASLRKEYDEGRITGAKYADTFLALMQGALQTALQFTLTKDSAFLAAMKAQADAIGSNNQNELLRLQAMMARSEFALTQLKLASEDASYGQAILQINSVIPAQVLLLTEQMNAQRGQTSGTRADGSVIFNPGTPYTSPPVPPTINGLMGNQQALYAQQKQSYIDDARVKATRVFTDLWTTQYTIATNVNVPNLASTTGQNQNMVNNIDVFNNMLQSMWNTATGTISAPASTVDNATQPPSGFESGNPGT